MPGQLRMQNPGAICHVVNRGERRESGKEKAGCIVREELPRRPNH
jgi:hypothetical protein